MNILKIFIMIFYLNFKNSENELFIINLYKLNKEIEQRTLIMNFQKL